MKQLQDYLNERYSKTAVKGYRNMIDRYLSYMQEKAENASYTDVLEYISYLRKLNLHPKSLRNNLFAIKMYYRYLVLTGKRIDHPCEKLYLQDQINRSIAVESLYSAVVLEELLETYKSKTLFLQKRDEVIISLLIYQALSVLEVVQIKVSNINLEDGTINIKGNIKNKGRTLNLKPKQIMLFYTYINETRARILAKTKTGSDLFILSENGTRLWQSGINRMINQDREAHKKLIPLKIRQSVIAHLLKQNNDIRVVQEFAGHRRTASTEAYKQTGLEELKSAIDRLHPLQ